VVERSDTTGFKAHSRWGWFSMQLFASSQARIPLVCAVVLALLDGLFGL
jgi:hypothetical protein